MKKILSTIILLAFIGGEVIVSAQDNNSNPRPSSPPAVYPWVGSSSFEGPRFEIVRPADCSSPYFRIDKYTGEVWKTNGVLNHNYVNLRREPSNDDIAKESEINYQLIVESSSHAYLMNLNTGIIWEYRNSALFKNKYDEAFFLMRDSSPY